MRARRTNRHAQRVALTLDLYEMSPREVYCGLVWLQRSKGFHPKFPLAAFRELYGTWPRPQDKGEPAPPPFELEEWLAMRPKRRRVAKERAS
jgi:hypothetical protein